MSAVYVGIDVGGTHTDGVAIREGRILHKVKVPTTVDLQSCTVQALGDLLEEVTAARVTRVVISTTLVTNAVIEERLEPVGLIATAGPGMNPTPLLPGDACCVVPGAIDHRGREIARLDESGVKDHLARFRDRGIRVLAAVGKFSVRNPAHELKIAELGGSSFDHVVTGHSLAGALNFPRRMATAYLAAGAWRRHTEFFQAIQGAMDRLGLNVPLYVLRADGGTQIAASIRNPAETALSGPAASIMGAAALDDLPGDSLTLDIGGTTTDISLFLGGAPLLEPRGATIGRFQTQIRSLFTRSTGAGGDSLVTVEGGVLRVGPKRLGPPAAFGGTHPTPTDALVVLGRALGDRTQAATALEPAALALGLSVEGVARQVLRTLALSVAHAVREFLDHVCSRPVYTIHELLGAQIAKPKRAVAVGGPARALAPYLEEALDLPVQVPDHFDVANAVGAALARINLEVNLLADAPGGHLSIPEAGIFRKIPSGYSLDQAKKEAMEAVLSQAKERGLMEGDAVAEIAEEESFSVVEGFAPLGHIHRLRAQIRPGLVERVR